MSLKKLFLLLYCSVPLVLSYIVLSSNPGYVLPTIALNTLFLVFTVFFFKEFKVLSKKVKEHKIKNQIYSEIINNLRAFRHDYINYLQIICGFAQIGRYKDIKYQADKMTGELVSIGNICKIPEPSIALYLLKRVKKLISSGIKVGVEIELKLDKFPVNTKDLIDILNIVFEQIEKVFNDDLSSELILDFFEGEMVVYVVFSIITAKNLKKIEDMLTQSIIYFKQKANSIEIKGDNLGVTLELSFYKNYEEQKIPKKQEFTVMRTG